MHSSPGSYPPGQGGGGYPPPPSPYASTPAPPPPYPPGVPGPGPGGHGGYGPPPRRPAKPPYSALRGTVAGLSLVLAVLLSIPALSAMWVRWEVVSSEGFTDNMVELIDEPAVRSEVARLMTDELIRQLPANLRGQVQPALFTAAVNAAIARPDFKPVWRDGVSTAHDVVMSTLLGRDSKNVKVDGDKVVVTLKTPMDTIVRELGAAGVPVSTAGLPTTIPIDLAQLPDTTEEQQGRDALRAVDDAGVWLPILAMALLVIGVAVAVNRFRALVMTGIGLALTSGLLLLMVSAVKGPVADELATRETLNRDGVEAVYTIFTDSLTTMSWSVFAAAIVAVAVGTIGLTVGARRR
ncbi:hypothetical protein [Streptomyces sp. SID3343]|uniref:hypothetical protein n=1 Tax=Streptomyces sp. SID3343 TaxID=2690260 RepID=UPI00136DCEFD|nr:hypothetical protein [Streptomyces sp. SID3343]MYV97518.1 hypothetical protein [Streptomyces sp. SID3343]